MSNPPNLLKSIEAVADNAITVVENSPPGSPDAETLYTALQTIVGIASTQRVLMQMQQREQEYQQTISQYQHALTPQHVPGTQDLTEPTPIRPDVQVRPSLQQRFRELVEDAPTPDTEDINSPYFDSYAATETEEDEPRG